MEYYGHTADDENGRRSPEAHWQLLRKHLRNVAELAKGFAKPLGLEAELVGSLRDFFQKQVSDYEDLQRST